jgi:ATP-dependent Clp protease protease subunit
MDYDINWGIERNSKRKYDSINDASVEANKQLKHFDLIEPEDLHIYSVGNEIHFSSPITLESIQKIIKEIQKLLHNNTKKSKTEKFTISYTIDSPGGSVLSVLKFVDYINLAKKKYKNVEFVSVITGLAASAGTIMALTAHKRLMTASAYAMVHELSSGNSGKFTFLSSHMDFVNQLHSKLVNIYVDATGKPKDEIEKLMKNETWFSAEEYKRLGFVDEIA